MNNQTDIRNRIGLSLGDKAFMIMTYAVLSLVLLAVLYPLVYIASASISSPKEVVSGNIVLLPKGVNFDAYKQIFNNSELMRGYFNTFKYTLIGTAINLLMTIAAAYPLSRRDLVGRHWITFLFVFTMFFSGGLIPSFLLVRELGLYNSMWALILPSAVSMWNIIIMRTFFQSSIPYEMQEAAQIDGCSNMTLLLRIVLPLSMPVIAVMVLFYGVGHWNSFFDALIYLSDRTKFPMQLIMREILLLNQSLTGENAMIGGEQQGLSDILLRSESMKYSAIIAANLPMFILYPFLQRYFVKGVMIGALKG